MSTYRKGYSTYNVLGPKKDDWTRSDRSYDRVRRPVVAESYAPIHTTEYVMKTETIMEQPVHAPSVGNRPDIAEEFFTKVQMEASQPRPKRFTPLSASVWRQGSIPTSGHRGHTPSYQGRILSPSYHDHGRGQSPTRHGYNHSPTYHNNGHSHSPTHHGHNHSPIYHENSPSHSPNHHGHSHSPIYQDNSPSHSPSHHGHSHSPVYHDNSRSHSPDHHDHSRSHSPSHHDYGRSHSPKRHDYGRSHSPKHHGVSNGYSNAKGYPRDGDYYDKNEDEYLKPRHDTIRPNNHGDNHYDNTTRPTTHISHAKPNNQVGSLSKPTNDIGQAIEYLKEAAVPNAVHNSSNSRFVRPAPWVQKRSDPYNETYKRDSTRRYTAPFRPIDRATTVDSDTAVRKYGAAIV